MSRGIRSAYRLALVAPDHTVIRPAYSEANHLNTGDANLRGAADLTTPSGADDVAVAGGYVYLAVQEDGLAVFLGCGLFADGFESGDTSAWSATVP